MLRSDTLGPGPCVSLSKLITQEETTQKYYILNHFQFGSYIRTGFLLWDRPYLAYEITYKKKKKITDCSSSEIYLHHNCISKLSHVNPLMFHNDIDDADDDDLSLCTENRICRRQESIGRLQPNTSMLAVWLAVTGSVFTDFREHYSATTFFFHIS